MQRYDMKGVPFKHLTDTAIEKVEVAKVCHEISSNYGRYEGLPVIMHRTTDLNDNWSVYYVENRGYGDYNIFGKYYD